MIRRHKQTGCSKRCGRCRFCCPKKKVVRDQDVADFIIVGLGTAGAPLARWLSEDAATSVRVFEAGQNRGDDPRVMQGPLFPNPPFGDPTLGTNPRYSFIRPSAPGTIRVGYNEGISAFPYSDGRCWGGGSCHNGMLAVRGTPETFDQWAAQSGNDQWSYANLLPIILGMENFHPNAATPPNPAQRGFAGLLDITQNPPLADVSGFYQTFATEANAPLIPDYNDPTYGDVGISAIQWFASPDNIREDASRAYIESIVDDDGRATDGRQLQITSKATVVEIIIEDDGSGPVARGVRYFLDAEPDVVREAFARRKVILCAGAIGSPVLLQLSGIGPASVLEPLGIPVIVANDNVGGNLDNHAGPAMLLPRGGRPSPVDVGHIMWDGSGDNIAQPADGIRRVQFVMFPVTAPVIPRSILTAIGVQDVPAITLISFILADLTATGTVEIVSTDPLTQPLIRFGHYEGADLDQAVDIYKLAANVSLEWTGLMPLYPPPAHYPAPYGPAPDDSLLRDDARGVSIVAYHAMGSCRMAQSAATGVVDGNLNVFGMESSLSVADDSVIPEPHKGNTAYPAYVIGLLKAEIEGAVIPRI